MQYEKTVKEDLSSQTTCIISKKPFVEKLQTLRNILFTIIHCFVAMIDFLGPRGLGMGVTNVLHSVKNEEK